MCKTRGDYGSGVTRPKIDAKDHFELKGQFLKELRDNTFSGLDHEDANEHIEKVLEISRESLAKEQTIWLNYNLGRSKDEISNTYCPPARTAKKMKEVNNFQQEPDETLYQAWERFKDLLMKCPQHYLTDMQETVVDAKTTIQDMAEYFQKWHNRTSRTRSTKTSDGLAAIQTHLNNLGREIKKVNEKVYAAQVGCELSSTDVAIKNQGASIKALEIHIGQMSKNSKLIFEPRQTTIPFPSRLYDDCYDEEKGSYGLKDLDAYSIGATLRNDSLPKKEKYPGSFTLPCYINNICFEKALANLGASASVMPLSTYLNLGLGELAHTKLIVELTDRTVKHPKGIAENILVGIVVKDMDPYPDEGMRDVIVVEPFCKASCVEDKMFDGIITICDEDDSVTYQMVSEQDKMNEISHSYQMLKGFYKGVLNLRPEFIRDAKVEEWLTRGHISV
ncbi:hypothetical protein Tco_1010608, partial [Tanacetum coccineum]